MRKPNGYWTIERCHEEALKYATRTKFENNSSSAYRISLNNGWINYICSHMILQHKPNGYWTKKRCHDEALKYDTRTDFQKKSASAYDKGHDNNWLDELCSHMSKVGNYKKRCIYVYVFNDNNVYIGLTYNMVNRHNRHLNDKRSQVYKQILISPIYKHIQLTEYIGVNEAIKMEEYYVNLYKENGWHILNKVKTGSVGGNTIKWSYSNCKEIALKYSTKSGFIKGESGAYRSALSNGWLDDICSHIELKIIKWSPTDIEYLRLNYSNQKTEHISKYLGRTSVSIRIKANRLKLSKPKR